MPNELEREPVEGFKLTKEQKAFYRVYKKVAGIQSALKRGISVQLSKLSSMQQMFEEVEGKRKELLLQAPSQGAFEAADEGMTVANNPKMENVDEYLRNAPAAER